MLIPVVKAGVKEKVRSILKKKKAWEAHRLNALEVQICPVCGVDAGFTVEGINHGSCIKPTNRWTCDTRGYKTLQSQ